MPDSQRVKITYTLGRELVYVDDNEAMKFAKLSEQIAKEINSDIDLAYSYRIQSSIYAAQGLFSLSTEMGLKARQIFEQQGDLQGLANNHITMGNLYRLQGLHSKSAEYHRLSHNYFKANGPEYRYAITCLNYGEALYYLDSLDKAKKLLHTSIIINDKIGNELAQTFSFKAMGLIYSKEQDYDSAKYYLSKAIEISDKLGSNSQKQATLESFINLAKIYEKENNLEEELKLLKRSLMYAQNYSLSKELSNIYFRLVELYMTTKNYEYAEEYMSKYRRLSDSMKSASRSDMEGLIDAAYNSLRTNLENEYLLKEKQISEDVIAYQKKLIFTIGFLALIAAASVIFVLISFRKLKKSNTQLEIQKEQIKNKSEELEELNATKDKMFSVVSHDMRSPLHSLLAFSDLVTKHYDSMSKEEVAEMIGQLKTNVDATLKMTENLIEWAKLQMQNVKTEPVEFDLNGVLDELVSVFQSVAEQKNIVLSLEKSENSIVKADKDQLSIIIRNLLNNAIKYTNEHGEVSLRGSQSENQVFLTIKDTGEGMSDELLNSLFELHVKSRVGTAGEKGTGLGLVLCYEYASKNNVKIEVHSKVKEGTTFTLTIPKA
ncbi:ATP-binding protein [Fulvivirga lutea]|uniref:histidine kinase n=1 Tax=Fulvivirga lutea TaxID=2810512 RepID=A0A974WJY6_9BACT|nr:HAMP domain-containing sensor histidine kinase [Fulvivirga lutea]QSE98537.1 HAMP domain-containing histidine kinase [Fulvivirga lutea]